LDHAQSTGKFYLRFLAADEPGVLAEIAGILGKHKISIASVIQHVASRTHDGFTPLVIMTDTSTEKDIEDAVETIDRLPSVRPISVRLRVHE
jgi:homoserine dehydrogenase